MQESAICADIYISAPNLREKEKNVEEKHLLVFLKEEASSHSKLASNECLEESRL